MLLFVKDTLCVHNDTLYCLCCYQSHEFNNTVSLLIFIGMEYGILASPWSSRIQEALDVLTGLFDMVGLRTNVAKTAGMTC